MASINNLQVYRQLLGACTVQCYPNIFYTDGTRDAAPTALATAVNTQASGVGGQNLGFSKILLSDFVPIGSSWR